MKRQLDFFNAETIAFPADRRLADVRAAAEELYRVHGDAAVKYWKTLIRSMSEPLISAGIPKDEVRRQMFAFQEAVQAELWRLGEQLEEIRK